MAFLPEKSMYQHLPDSVIPPSGYKMDTSGLVLPECLVDVEDVEHMFSTARTYLYYMNRLSGKKWEEEQLTDDCNCVPINVENIEQGTTAGKIRQPAVLSKLRTSALGLLRLLSAMATTLISKV